MGYHRPGDYAPAPDLHKQISDDLISKLALGESKYQAKREGRDKDKIYSQDTYHTYAKWCHAYADFVIAETGDRHTDIADAIEYAEDYITTMIDEGKSPYTIKMVRSALAKLYDCQGVDICKYTPPRVRTEILRSRDHYIESEKTDKMILNQSKRAGHFSETTNADIVNFARGTGLRRCELTSVRGDQLYKDADGNYRIALKGSQCKGGRPRSPKIIGDHIDDIVEKFRAAGNGRVWDKVPAAMDVHYYRAQYAKDMYNSIARDIDTIPRAERYDCRGDLRGYHYDKIALQEVSHNLGHNRIRVVVDNYLRY